MAAEGRYVERSVAFVARKKVTTWNISQQQCFKMQYTNAIKRFHVLFTKCETPALLSASQYVHLTGKTSYPLRPETVCCVCEERLLCGLG